MRYLFLLFTATAAATDRQLQLPSGITKCDDADNFGNIMTYTEANPMPFCANHGTCRYKYENHPEQPCECSEGYAGPHCEYMSDEVPKCTLKCQNGGKCMVGAVSWEDIFKETLFESQYCMCPDGYSGDECEHAPQPCGDELTCLNGGSCVKLNDNGVETYHCDCTSAGTEDRAFAGEACEYPSSTICSEELDNNGRHFCVNGGTCEEESHMGCICDSGFVGPVCEFKDLGMDPPTCNLQCYNHGICRKGAKDLSVLKEFGINRNRHTRHLQEAYNEDFEHCVCPAGYAGLQCEYQVDVCPGGGHVCLNGGDCKPEVNGDTLLFTCDCSQAKTKSDRFAGDYCEMPSTEFCTVDRKKTSGGKGENAFCTNDGTCRGLVQHGQQHPGCDCIRGYFGDQCQFVGGGARIGGGGDSSDDDKNGLVSILAIVTLLLVIGIFFTLYVRRKGSNICGPRNTVIDTAPAPTMDNFEEVDPWNAKDLFEEGDLSDDGEHYDDIDITDRDETDDGDNEEDLLPSIDYGNDDFDDDSAQNFDTTFSLSAYEGDSSVADASAASSITMDTAEGSQKDKPAEPEYDGGPVLLMKTDGSASSAVVISSSSASSITSAQSEQLHVFKDSSFDGSENQLV